MPRVKLLPKILAIFLIVGVSGYGINLYLDKNKDSKLLEVQSKQVENSGEKMVYIPRNAPTPLVNPNTKQPEQSGATSTKTVDVVQQESKVEPLDNQPPSTNSGLEKLMNAGKK